MRNTAICGKKRENTLRKKCKLKAIKFYTANDTGLAVFLTADGIYLSAYNNSLKNLSLIKSNFHIIGSAHNLKEITIKIVFNEVY